MKLKYETAVATFMQFVIVSFLGIANAINSIISSCRHGGKDCTTNLLLSLIFFILTTGWFAAIWATGYLAQERRSRRLAQLLIAAEGLVSLVALFNARHHTDFLSLITSVVDLILAIWIITLAFRLMRAGGGRVVSSQRRRRRRHSD